LKDASAYRKKALATADDLVDADGERILTYGEAVERARLWNPDADPDTEKDQGRPPTVADVVRSYLDWYKEHRRAYDRVRYQLEAHVVPELGDVLVEELTTARLRRWHEGLAKKPAKLRSSKTSKKRTRKAKTPEQIAARKSTANRVLSMFKAALNKAWADGKVDDRVAWQRVKPYENVDSARVRALDHDEMRRLVNACEPDFRDIVLAALYGGARWGELTRLRVEDARLEVSGVFIPKSKSGNPRTLFLNEEGAELFERLTVGRSARDLIFTCADGSPWGKNHQQRRIREACEQASIVPRIVFHELRHTYSSIYLMAGGGVPDLAKQLGHSTTRMVEKHYGHLADSWRADQARQFAPALGLKPSGKVRRIRRREAS